MDPVKAAPFELGHGQDAVLVLHGFTGSPWDVRPLGEVLAARGYHVRGICLPGHGVSPEAMLGVTWRDWERAATAALSDLSSHRRIFVAGLSMGALLALILAAQAPERVEGLALLAPAMRFRGPLLPVLHALSRVPFSDRLQRWVTKSATDLADPLALAEAPILHRWPMQRLRDLWTIQDRARAGLGRVRAPTLVALSSQDHVVSPEGAEELAHALIHARQVSLMRFERGFHIMPRDLDRERVCDEVLQFFDRCGGREHAEGEVRAGH
jgi:carboxylesterase